MTRQADPSVLEHSLELYVPTRCRCGKELPSDAREAVFAEAKQKFVDWFGGGSIRVESVQGVWGSDSGLMEESVDVIYSNANRATLDEHSEDFRSYAADLANRLTQESVACRVDGKMSIYPSTDNPKPHRCAKGSAPDKLPKALRVDEISRMKSLQAALQRLSSVSDVRDLFCNVLHYDYEADILPTGKWPEGVKQCLAPGTTPQIIADQNGFKIIYLQLAEDRLRKSFERQIIQRIIKDTPGMRGLVVVSDIDQKQWNLVNVRFDRTGEKGDSMVLRRMRVGPSQSVRTAVERLILVDALELAEGTSAAELQDVHDRAFDVEAVTRQFFGDIANWYFWALQYSKFPKDAPKEEDGQDHISLIRLITRLVFCWFLREKGLIPEVLFERRKLDDFLVGFDPNKPSNKESVFYRAILQNLFFATLNTEMGERGWARKNQNFMAHSLYRHKECFGNPTAAIDLFRSIPFLNGGLFECLDKDLGEKNRPRYLCIDGFSRSSKNQPTVPDFLFFGKDREVDLSKEYGNKKFKKVRVRGLVETLRYYNFTIEENTPIEEEVALDPELCGKVFENLLAAYNPETGETARKQTGSFYTPRGIVNCLVDGALIASLTTKVTSAIQSSNDVEERLRHLFAYNDAPHQFKPKEVECLIAAIDSLRTLDPAVGSGAFPMGILHRLVFVLGKLDPGNQQWKERQIARVRDAIVEAEKIEDDSFRARTVEDLERRIEGVNEAFERNELDYGRKLYLIENCIYGVDIQPIAVQIAKMRFFISLIVDQRIDLDAPNLGVKPLPNLETRFVAADTLVRVDRPGQQLFRNPEIDAKEAELQRVRVRHFSARTPLQKTKYRNEDSRLRTEIADLLEKDGWGSATAAKLASWDPYDQNASAEYFDSEWMFGIVEGFDVVVGNPPYVRIQTLKETAPDRIHYYKGEYESARKGNYDLYVVFVERGLQLTAKDGQLAYILPHKFFNAKYGESLRGLLSRGRHLRHVVHFGDQQIFPGATNYVCLLFLAKSGREACKWRKVDDIQAWLSSEHGDGASVVADSFTASEWNVVLGPRGKLFEKLAHMPVNLEQVTTRIFQGLKTSADQVYIVDLIGTVGDRLRIHSPKLDADFEVETDLMHPLIKGGDCKRFEIAATHRQILFPYAKQGDEATALIPQSQLRAKFPLTWAYLKANKKFLEGRENGKMKHDGWYGYVYPKALDIMSLPKIITPDIAPVASFAFDATGDLFFTGGVSGGYGIFVKPPLRPQFVLGVLNSRLADFFLHEIATEMRGGWFSYEARFIRRLPMPSLDFSDSSQRAQHDAVAGLVDRILKLKEQGAVEEARALESEVGERVYGLFELSKAEIGLVEEEEN